VAVHKAKDTSRPVTGGKTIPDHMKERFMGDAMRAHESEEGRRRNPPRSKKKTAGKQGKPTQSAPQQIVLIMHRPIRGTRPHKPRDYRAVNKFEFQTMRYDRDPYNEPRDATDPRFHTLRQQDIYETLYMPLKDRVIKQRYIDWKYIRTHGDKFHDIYEVCHDKGLDTLMGLKYHWNEEVIMQFYATLYLEKDDARTMHWMTNGVKYTSNIATFAQALGQPGLEDGDAIRIHDSPQLNAKDISDLYLDNLEGVPGTLTGLEPYYITLNKLFRHTLMPKSGDASFIRAYSLNLLNQMKFKEKIHVMDLLYQEIRFAMAEQKRSLPYGPYIQKFIDHVSGAHFYKDVEHGSFQPRAEKAPSSGAPSSGPSSSRAKKSSSPGSSSTLNALKSLFCFCKRIDRRQEKIRRSQKKSTLRQKKILAHLNLPVSPEGSEGASSDDDEDFPDPFSVQHESPPPALSSDDDDDEG